MEGAGESIVSHAAERRGMDSADEEPELPSAVQDLIRRLEGEGEPITGLPDLSEEEFWDFFPEIASLSTITGWRRQVRLRVLEAIGSCNTFESLKVDDICGRDISRFTESEWEVVFRGFKSSTVLGSICLQNLKWSSDAEVESLCSQIGRILNSSSVQELEIFNTNLSARCWLHLASGLRGNSDSKLQSLKLVSNAVKHVADIINSATRLETLSLAGTEDVEDVEEEDVGILSKALIQSSSLKELYLEQVDWGAALLLNALARDDGNRSIERLWLSNMDRLGSCFRELLTSNRSLKGVTLNYLRMSPEEWRQLGEVIRDNATATTINVSLWLDQDDTYKHESIEGLAYAASSEAKDPTLELSQEFSHESELMFSLNLLGRVLRGEIKSLKSFRIWDFRTQPYQDRTEGILSMNGQTGETSVLKRLELVIGSKDVWKRVWKDLLLCLRGNTSLTHLDLHLRELDEEEFRDLMGLLQVNLTLQEIDVSGTPWATDGKEGLIQEALKQNQKRAVYMIIEYSQEFRQTGTPKRPYVTDDVNSLYKISASLHVGTTVRLHLMCESTTGVHTVKDQEGLKIRVDRYNKKWIRKTIEIFYKVLYYAAKAALGKTLGLGQAIPDFADLKSDILKLDDISRSDRSAILKGRESMELKEAWLRIQQTLAPINYSKIFKLYQVKYVRVELGGHAWVCEECMTKGFRTGILSRN
ncbi:hypothetical protein AXG93_4697s1330 [Marchantia polymorpha subsp. ruderalis]|uniref:Uncharacterized protein n=1 Tax=Marchantia polymorpha subsp. ruderalis TaxID=1480154 RepID=A0A176VRK8_MARPO|nr:hypothetical protein AXG93_4697s1330 [Marchantia polymorpha subsp. ruderalis]